MYRYIINCQNGNDKHKLAPYMYLSDNGYVCEN